MNSYYNIYENNVSNGIIIIYSFIKNKNLGRKKCMPGPESFRINQEKLIKFISAKGIKKCPICGQATLTPVPEHIGEIGQFSTYARRISKSKTLPVITFVCQNCAAIIPFSAVQAGVLEEIPQEAVNNE